MNSDTLKLIYKKNLTEDLAVFRFQLSDGSQVAEFKPGQFIELGLILDGDKITYRDYTISSPPHEKEFYEFYIKHKEHPDLGKFTTPLFNMKINDVVFWKKPRGVFTIEETKPDAFPEERQMILVASGTGLAPFMSYILHLKKIGTRKKIVLLHGVSYAAELGYRELLEKLASEKDELWDFRYVPIVSRPNEPLSKNWNGNTGRVESLISGIKNHNSKIENILGTELTKDNSLFYLCGYKNMIDYVDSMLYPLGFVPNRKKRDDGTFDIKYELYGI